MMEKVIIAVLILLIVGLLLTTERVRAICCDAIKKEVENKMEANQTLCSHRNQYQKALPENCCKDIASEVEKYVAAYETLCAGAKCLSPKPLGMASGRIPDKAITASSFYDHRYKPSNGRLNTKIGSCAWTSTARGRSNSWFEVDLGQMTIVTSIATQGSCTAGEWTKSYSITYYNTSSSQWVDYKESGSKKVFQANSDGQSIVTHKFKNPFRTRLVRLSPLTWQNYPALRVEYYGCPW